MDFLLFNTSWIVVSGLTIPRCNPKFGAEKFASTINTLFPNSFARTVPKFETVVVLPTPPFMAIIPMVLQAFFLLIFCIPS